jgi:hypothetical protein
VVSDHAPILSAPSGCDPVSFDKGVVDHFFISPKNLPVIIVNSMNHIENDMGTVSLRKGVPLK